MFDRLCWWGRTNGHVMLDDVRALGHWQYGSGRGNLYTPQIPHSRNRVGQDGFLSLGP